VYIRNSHTQGNADSEFGFGNPGDRMMAGDWTGDGVFTPAAFRPSNTTTYFSYTTSSGSGDFEFVAGQPAWVPVSGDPGTP
jgi:lactocepin